MDRMPPRANNGLSSARPARPTPEPIDEPAIETPKAPVAPARTVATPHRQENKRKKPTKKRLIIIGIIIAVLVIAAGVALSLFRQPSTGAAIDNSKYQAVFFTNGQVYFGKLASYNNNYMKLTNVFYLQSKDNTTDSKNPQKTQTQDNSDVQLIKLGNEIHGPDDEMLISKEQILFFENLKKDGKVASTISQYQSQSAK